PLYRNHYLPAREMDRPGRGALMSEPTNAQMAHECMRTAETAASSYKANVESMAAQTYAILALVDAIRDMSQGIRDTVAEEVSFALAEEVSSALMDVVRGGAK